MNISVDDIKNISSYKEDTSGGIKQITYLEMVSSDDAEEIARIKSLNRDLAIDAIVDDKIEEYENRNESLGKSTFSSHQMSYPTQVGSYTTTITPVFRKIQVTPYKFISYEECYNHILDHIEQSTHKSNQKDLIYIANPTYSEKENISLFNRRLQTTIIACSNMIAVESRRGPATTILIGKGVLKLLIDSSSLYTQHNLSSNIVGILAGINVITSDRISPDKVIVLRAQRELEAGLMFIENKHMSQYYFAEAEKTFDNMFKYFRVN